MNKIKKRIIGTVLALAIIATSGVALSAASISFNTITVPKAQGMVYLGTAKKSSGTSYGTVKLTRKDPDAVTFSARSVMGQFTSGTTVNSTSTVVVGYDASYPAGTTMQARFRNHNWSNNTNYISGTFDYK